MPNRVEIFFFKDWLLIFKQLKPIQHRSHKSFYRFCCSSIIFRQHVADLQSYALKFVLFQYVIGIFNWITTVWAMPSDFSFRSSQFHLYQPVPLLNRKIIFVLWVSQVSWMFYADSTYASAWYTGRVWNPHVIGCT